MLWKSLFLIDNNLKDRYNYEYFQKIASKAPLQWTQTTDCFAVSGLSQFSSPLRHGTNMLDNNVGVT